MTLKKFGIEIKGTFCDVPHDERRIELYGALDGEEIIEEEKLTDLETMVIVHECLCKLKHRLNTVMNRQETDRLSRKFHAYFFGTQNENTKLKPFAIIISGLYGEEPNSGREIVINNKNNQLTDGQTSIVLFEIVCVMRNQLLESMTRMQIAEFAKKHNMVNFGMLTDEEPFDVR